jgi:hypothetical protein
MLEQAGIGSAQGKDMVVAYITLGSLRVHPVTFLSKMWMGALISE